MKKKNSSLTSGSAGARWVCPSCKNRVKTNFCPRCGESVHGDSDLKVKGLFAQFFQAFSSVDGRLIRTLRYLTTQPGVLTMAYMQGRRVPYIPPFQLFLIANVLFFAMQSLTNTNIVSSPMDSHLHAQDWNVIANELVTRRLDVKGMSLDAYAPLFDQAVIFYGKSLIILMTLPFMLLLYVMSVWHRRPFVTHAVFALHFYTFLLLLFSVCLIIGAVSMLLGGGGLSSDRVDKVLTLMIILVSSIYLYFAIGVVYGPRTFPRVIKAIVLGMSVTAILLGYRFTLFLITLYTT